MHLSETSPPIGSPTLCTPDLQVVLPEGAYDVTPKLAIEYDSVAFDTQCGALSLNPEQGPGLAAASDRHPCCCGKGQYR